MDGARRRWRRRAPRSVPADETGSASACGRSRRTAGRGVLGGAERGVCRGACGGRAPRRRRTWRSPRATRAPSPTASAGVGRGIHRPRRGTGARRRRRRRRGPDARVRVEGDARVGPPRFAAKRQRSRPRGGASESRGQNPRRSVACGACPGRGARAFFQLARSAAMRATAFQHASSVREGGHTFDHERPRPRRDSQRARSPPRPARRARLSLAPAAGGKTCSAGVAALPPTWTMRARVVVADRGPSRRRRAKRWTDTPSIAFRVRRRLRQEGGGPRPRGGGGGGEPRAGGGRGRRFVLIYRPPPRWCRGNMIYIIIDAAAAIKVTSVSSPLSSLGSPLSASRTRELRPLRGQVQGVPLRRGRVEGARPRPGRKLLRRTSGARRTFCASSSRATPLRQLPRHSPARFPSWLETRGRCHPRPLPSRRRRPRTAVNDARQVPTRT